MNRKILLFSLLALSAGTAVTLNMQDDDVYRVRDKKERAAMKGQHAGGKNIAGAIEQMYALRANPNTGEVTPSDVYKAMLQIEELAKAHYKTQDSLKWEELGPDNVGGRTRAVLVDNKNPNILYAGSVGGGMFKSVSGGTSWSRINGNDLKENLAVSCITQMPDGYIYYGTGEQAFTQNGGRGLSGVVGRGIYRSRDGVNFALVPSTDAAVNNMWANVNSLGTDPVKNIIYAANSNGLYHSDSASTAWTRVTGSPSTICKELKVARDGTVLAVFGTQVWKSQTADGTKGWARVGGTSIPITNDRISIAIAPSDENYMYCMVSNNANSKLLAIYQSKDAGASWSVIGTGGNPLFDPLSNSLQGQGYYNNVIAVYPEDREKVLVGGVELWSWTPAGGWKKAASTFESASNPTYVHADKHVLLFDGRTTPSTLYIGSDGGVSKSLNGGATYVTINRGFNVTQFYAVAADDQGRTLGGTQDNGTQFVNRKGNTKIAGIEIFGGDGFYSEISRINPNALFVESYNGTASRSLNNGLNFNRFYDTKFIEANAQDPGNPDNTLFESPFNTPYLLWENTEDSSSKFFIAMNNSIWMTRGALNFSKTPTWYKIAEFPGRPQCLEYNTSGNVLFIGTQANGIYRVTGIETGVYDTSSSWVASDNGIITEAMPFNTGGRAVTGMSVHFEDSNLMVFSMGHYGFSDYIYKTTNATDTAANVTFTSISGNMPDIPVYDVCINMKDPSHILAATEYGMYTTDVGGGLWKENNQGMARVATYMIRQYEFHPGEGVIFYIATHGRGFFRSTSLMTGIKKTATTAPAIKMNVYPNPASDYTTLQFTLNKVSDVNIQVMNIQGKTVYSSVLGKQQEGTQEIPLNTAGFSPGTYFVSVTTNQQRSVSKFIVVR
jgi:hypothetical protein